MKKTYIIFAALFCVFLLFSCDSGLKFENPNDPNNQTSDSKKTGTLGGECYPNKTCNEGLTCDKENNICIEEPDNTNDDDKTDTMSSNDEDKTDITPDNSDSVPDEDAYTDSGDSTTDNDTDSSDTDSVDTDSSDTADTEGDTDLNGIWVDPNPFNGAIHLMWENPMGNTGMGGTGISHANAETYCNALVLAGHDDWRLPTIDELRTLVRGVSTTMTGGTCPTSESCSNQDSCNKNKNNSQPYGYSCFGCYALDDQYKDGESFLTEDDCQLSSSQLENNECYIVPAMFGDPCNGTWSNTPNTSTAGTLVNAFWYLNYKAGYIGSDSDTLSGANWVRCVREGTAADVTEEEELVKHRGYYSIPTRLERRLQDGCSF